MTFCSTILSSKIFFKIGTAYPYWVLEKYSSVLWQGVAKDIWIFWLSYTKCAQEMKPGLSTLSRWERSKTKPGSRNTNPRAMKVLYCIFFDAHGRVASICVPKKQSITAQFYIDECLTEVEKRYYSKRPSRGARGIRLLHDNARPHIAQVVGEKLRAIGMVELPNPPYSLDHCILIH